MTNRKFRISVPQPTVAVVLFAADRTCCKCRIAGRAVQVHHIDDDPANNDPRNLAVLCLECHNETLVQGGFGRQLTGEQIVIYRDDWHRRVLTRRDDADRLSSKAMAATACQFSIVVPAAPPQIPDQTCLLALVRSLPELRRLAYRAAQSRWAGSTLDIVEGCWDVIRVFESSWVALASYYPAAHFGQEDSRDYFSSLIAERAGWHYLCGSTGGVGYSGTIVQVMTARAVLGEVERMIEETVLSLTGGNLGGPDDLEIDLDAWRASWSEDVNKEPNEGVAPNTRPQADGSATS